MTEDPRGLFVFERGGDLSVFPSISAARAYMEAIDVANGEYEALFAVDGRIVTVSARDDATAADDITFTVTSKRGDTELDRRLAEYRRASSRVLPEDRLAFANAILLWEWESRWPKRPRWLARRLHGDGPVQL
jgi:hypothetical protein